MSAAERSGVVRTPSSSGRATRSIASTRVVGRPFAGSCRRSSRRYRRGVSRLGEVAGDFLRARVVAEAVQTAVRRRRTSRARSGSRRARLSRRSGATRGSRRLLVVVPDRKRLPRGSRGAPSSRSRAEARRGCVRWRRHVAACGLERRRSTPAPAGSSAKCCATARTHRPARPRARRERISISVENTFERDLVDRERLHDELRGMAREVAEHLQRRTRLRATVTTKLRYADSRSVAAHLARRRIDDAAQIASSPAGCSTAACRTVPARCDSSSGVSGSLPTAACFDAGS